VTAVLTITLVAVDLLGVGDAAELALPVVAVAGLVLGVYLGAEPRRRDGMEGEGSLPRQTGQAPQ